MLAIRDRFFVDKEFNYVRQANIPWKLLGPIPNGGKTEKEFAPEEDNKAGKMRDSYEIDGVTYEWSGDDYTGPPSFSSITAIFRRCSMAQRWELIPTKPHLLRADLDLFPKAQTVPFWISGHTWATSDWRNGPASVPGKWFHADPKFL